MDSIIYQGFKELAEYYHHYSAVLYYYHKHVFEKHYNKREIDFPDQLTDDQIRQADEYFDFTFKQNLEAATIGIDQSEIEDFGLIDEPGMHSALSLISEFFNNERRAVTVSSQVSFLFLSEDVRLLSTIYDNFEEVLGELNKWEEYQNLNPFYYLESLRDSINYDLGSLFEYWFGKRDVPKVFLTGRAGGAATKRAYTNRITKIQKELVINAKPDSKGRLRIRKKLWQQILMNVNDGIMPSYPTIKKYKDEIESNFSNSFKIPIKVELIK